MSRTESRLRMVEILIGYYSFAFRLRVRHFDFLESITIGWAPIFIPTVFYERMFKKPTYLVVIISLVCNAQTRHGRPGIRASRRQELACWKYPPAPAGHGVHILST
jgi:hypothetical protein